jgi:hypothetical protein
MSGRAGALLGRWLQMRCTIQPRKVGATNADNRPVVAYDTPVTGVPCRLMEKDERLVFGVAVAGSVDYDKLLLVAADVVIMPFDQVGAIERPDPAHAGQYLAYDSNLYIVKQVLDRADRSVQFRSALLGRVGG